ncbi:MAG TPA: hypothetical protein VFB00_10460 [Terriglobales bacterium]|nr:hypothetical protein [Terriglobales bacterium]
MPASQSLRRTVLKNALANAARLAGSGLIALAMPPLLVRMLPPDVYGAWALLLQLALYFGFLDFGAQIAVARFVAHAGESHDPERRDGLVSSAFVLLMIAAVFGMALVLVLAWQLPNVFHSMPAGLVYESRLALILMGGSLALGLPLLVIHAVFIGFQRNAIPVSITLANRVTAAVLTVAAVLRHAGLAVMGGAVALANVLSSLSAYVAWRRWAAQVRIRISLFSRPHAREIIAYCASLTVWSAGMLMVSGLDLSIVGIFDFKATPYYAVAATLTNFIAQAQGAIFAALLPASAVLHARGDAAKLGEVLILSTRYGMLILLAMALPLLVLEKPILGTWVGYVYAEKSRLILEVLLIANIVRLSALPYATLLLGAGEQKKVVLSPLAEGLTNLLASVAGAYVFGAIGVAIGTLIGAFVGVGLHLWHNMPRTSAIRVNRMRLIREGFARPLLCIAPLALLLVPRMAKLQVPAASFVDLAAVAGTALLFWKRGLVSSERQRVESVLRLS